MLSNTSPDFELIVRQQPEQARVAGGKEKGMPVLLTIWLSIETHERRARVLTFFCRAQAS